MPILPSFKKAVAAVVDPMDAEVMKERLRQLQDSRQANDDKHVEGSSKRVSNRSKTMRVGEIFLEDGSTVSCVVRDFSKTGMRLTLAEFSQLPEEFRLRAPTLGFDSQVTLVRQTDQDFAVSFF